jgi:hypothetical protein
MIAHDHATAGTPLTPGADSTVTTNPSPRRLRNLSTATKCKPGSPTSTSQFAQYAAGVEDARPGWVERQHAAGQAVGSDIVEAFRTGELGRYRSWKASTYLPITPPPACRP